MTIRNSEDLVIDIATWEENEGQVGHEYRQREKSNIQYHYNANLIPSSEIHVMQYTILNIQHFSLTSFFCFSIKNKEKQRTLEVFTFVLD